MKKFFVINDGTSFLWEDGNFYPPFIKPPYAVDEDIAVEYVRDAPNHITIELADPQKFPSLYGIRVAKPKVRRTYVRCSSFALANALDRLYDDDDVYNLMLSMEDSEFLISFEYKRDYERRTRSASELPQSGNVGDAR